MGYRSVQLRVLDNFVPKEHTSASRLGLFIRCQRWWGFEKLYGLVEEKERPWLSLGKEVEYYQQKYLEGYAIPQDQEAGRRALASLHLLPDPTKCVQILHQDPIRVDTSDIVPSIEKFELRGAKDLLVNAGHWHLYDYKTTRGNTRIKDGEWAYVKTRQDLEDDVQGNFYAYDVFRNYCPDAYLHARWIFTLTDMKKHPDARATDVLFSRELVGFRMRQFVELADWHRSIARQFKRAPFDVNGLRPNADACETFGGCPYRPAVGGPCRQPSRNLGDMLTMTTPNGAPTDIEKMLEERRAQGMAQAGAPPGYPSPAPTGVMPAPAAPPQPPQYTIGSVVNGHVLGADGQWRPAPPPAPPAPPPAPAVMPPPGPPAGPPGYYAAPPSPVLPPEAYAPPPSPPAGPPAIPGVPAGMLPPPAAPAPATGKKGKKAATPPSAPEDPADETQERAQFMRACVLACSGNVDQLLAGGQNPAQLSQAIVSYAHLVWQYLQHAGA